MFWDSLYLEFTSVEIRYSKLFEIDEPNDSVIQKINLYLEKENYYQLKTKLLQNQYRLHFYEENLKDLPRKLKKQYQGILLSNIAKYIQYMYKWISDENDFYLSEFKKTIDSLSSNLSVDGIFFIAYLYNIKKGEVKQSSIYPIYDTLSREAYFPSPQYSLFHFIGIKQLKCDYGNVVKDAVMIYKKNQ